MRSIQASKPARLRGSSAGTSQNHIYDTVANNIGATNTPSTYNTTTNLLSLSGCVNSVDSDFMRGFTKSFDCSIHTFNRFYFSILKCIANIRNRKVTGIPHTTRPNVLPRGPPCYHGAREREKEEEREKRKRGKGIERFSLNPFHPLAP